MTEFITTRIDYYKALSICGGTRCAADLLTMFEQWAKREAPGYWFKVRQQDLAQDLGGLYGKDVIAQATQLLYALGMVCCHNHSRDGQIHTFSHEFIPAGLATLLDFYHQSFVLIQSLVSTTCQFSWQRFFPFLKPWAKDDVSNFLTFQAELPLAQGEEQKRTQEWETSLYIAPQSFELKIAPHSNAIAVREKKENSEIRRLTAGEPLMQGDQDQEFSPTAEPPHISKAFTATTASFLKRLRGLNLPPTCEVRSLMQRNPKLQLERNILASEEEAAKKGLTCPVAAAKYLILNKAQPRHDRQSWWNRAADALARQGKNRLKMSAHKSMKNLSLRNQRAQVLGNNCSSRNEGSPVCKTFHCVMREPGERAPLISRDKTSGRAVPSRVHRRTAALKTDSSRSASMQVR